jgi:hypothetical protein
MDLSFREKSLWASTLATALVYGNYFATAGVFAGERSGMVRLLSTVMLLVFVEVTCEIAINIFDRPQPKDERDRIIEGKGYRSGYVVATVGLVTLLMGYGALHVTQGAAGGEWMEPIAVAQLLLLLLVLAELAKSGTMIFHYRRGA